MKNQTFSEQLLSWIVLVALFLTPLMLFSGRLFAYVTSKSFFFMGLAEIALFLWVYIAAVNPKYRLSKKQIIWFLVPGLFPAAFTISAVLSVSPNLAFWSSFERGTGLIFLYHAFAFSLVVASVVKAEGEGIARKIYQAVFYSGIVLALSTFISAHFINIPGLYFFDDVDSANLLGNSSLSSAYLIFSAFLGAILFQKSQNTKQKIWIAIGLVIVLLSPIISAARGVSVAIFVGAVFALFAYLAVNGKKQIRILGFALLGLTVAGCVFVGASLVDPASKIHQVFADAASNSRFVFWGAAAEGIKEKPLFGWGGDNFNVIFSKHFDTTILKSGSTAEIAVDRPHNVLLENFAAGGFVGGILYLIFILSLFAIPIYLYRKGTIGKAYLAILEGMFFAYFLQDQIMFDTVPALVALFSLFGAMAGTMPFAGEGKRLNDKIAKTLIALACLGLFVLSWVHFVNQPVRKAKVLARVLGSIETGQNDFKVLGEISPMGNANEASLIGASMLVRYSQDLSSIVGNKDITNSVHGEIEAYLAQIDTMQDVTKNNLRTYLSAAELQLFDLIITKSTSEEGRDRAFKYLAHAEELSPENPRVYWIYGRLYFNARDFAKAREAFEKAVALDPDVTLSQKYLAEFNAAVKNK